MLKKTLLISIGVLSILLYSLPTSAFAAETTVVKGTLGGIIGVTVPPEILVALPNGVLSAGSSNPSAPQTITIKAVGGWTMTAKDLTNDGYMKKNGTPLTNRLQIGKTGSLSAMITANNELTYSGNGDQTVEFYADQFVTYTDSPGNYTITITFTITPIT